MAASVTPISTVDCELGEGIVFDPCAQTLWWMDIVGCRMLSLRFRGDCEFDAQPTIHALPFMASVVARIDDDRQLLAAEDGLYVREVKTGVLRLHRAVEADLPGNRSNDGRVHPCGALWIGTMGRRAEKAAGSIYHFRDGELRPLWRKLTIPNAIAFSPDGSVAYFTDTADGRLMRVACDPLSGLPTGEPEVFHDGRDVEGGMDGAIVDSDGMIWNARWGGAALDRFAPDGSRAGSIAMPVSQPSCPAFVPGGIAVTSAWQGMDKAARHADPLAGFTFLFKVDVRPQWEPAASI